MIQEPMEMHLRHCLDSVPFGHVPDHAGSTWCPCPCHGRARRSECQHVEAACVDCGERFTASTSPIRPTAAEAALRAIIREARSGADTHSFRHPAGEFFQRICDIADAALTKTTTDDWDPRKPSNAL